MTNYVIEVAPGKKTRPVKHLYEAFFYALVGHGSTTVWLPNGETRSFEWDPKALFAIPLNCQYQIFNNSGLEAYLSRLASRLRCSSISHNLNFVSTIPSLFRIAPANRSILRGDLRSYETKMQYASVTCETNSSTIHELQALRTRRAWRGIAQSVSFSRVP
jgi:hypothetical protein